LPLQTSDLENILNRIHTWNGQVDQKVSIFLTAQAAVLAFVSDPLTTWFNEAGLTHKAAILLGVALQVAALYKSTRALFPDTNNPHEPTSVTFFGHVGRMPFADYDTRLRTISDEEYRHDFVTQIHVSARIVADKVDHFKVSVLLSGIGLAIVGVAFWLSRLGFR